MWLYDCGVSYDGSVSIIAAGRLHWQHIISVGWMACHQLTLYLLGDNSVHSSATLSTLSRLLPVTTTLNWRFENNLAASAPIPELLPVIKTTFASAILDVTAGDDGGWGRQ